MWGEVSITTALGAKRGLDSSREHDRLYRATMQAVADGLILGRGRHGVVVALTNDPSDSRFSLAVKIVSKVFMPSGKGREGSFHRVVAHTLHVQNEVASNAKLSDESTFVLPLYAAMQDDTYVYLVMERACCSLKQLIQHGDDGEQRQLLNFQEEHPLKFLSFCTLTTAAMLHACWTMQVQPPDATPKRASSLPYPPCVLDGAALADYTSRHPSRSDTRDAGRAVRADSARTCLALAPRLSRR